VCGTARRLVRGVAALYPLARQSTEPAARHESCWTRLDPINDSGSRLMKRLTGAGRVVVAVAVVGWAALAGRTQTKAPPKPEPTGKQVLMRDKLTHAKDVLEGLSVEDFDKVAKGAEYLRMISKAAAWYVFDSDEYLRMSKDFQEQATDLERHAKAKNLDASSLDYVRISLTCVQCHKYMRENKGKKKP
jgi:hypothetical protein